MVRIERRHRKFLWRALGIGALCWLAVAVVRAATGVQGHPGLLAVLGARAVLTLGAVFFLYILAALYTIWWERWDWPAGYAATGCAPSMARNAGTAGSTARPSFIVWVILELGLYWLAFLNGYGLVLMAYALYSLAWHGSLGIS